MPTAATWPCSRDELPGAGTSSSSLPFRPAMSSDRARTTCSTSAAGRTLAGFENHAGRTKLDDGAAPLGRVVSGFGNDGESGAEGCRLGRAVGTYLHGPLLPRNPWLADWLLAQALAHATGGEPPELEPLPDELESRAHAISAERARTRGGRF